MSDAVAFFDAVCPKCRRKIGWCGRLVDRPICRCGHQIDPVALAKDQAEMDDFRKMLAELRQANPGWDKWRDARVAAGLTLRQAAKLLEMEPVALSGIEQGREKPSVEMAEKMAACYGA